MSNQKYVSQAVLVKTMTTKIVSRIVFTAKTSSKRRRLKKNYLAKDEWTFFQSEVSHQKASARQICDLLHYEEMKREHDDINKNIQFNLI
jgi:hypothetical protein